MKRKNWAHVPVFLLVNVNDHSFIYLNLQMLVILTIILNMMIMRNVLLIALLLGIISCTSKPSYEVKIKLTSAEGKA